MISTGKTSLSARVLSTHPLLGQVMFDKYLPNQRGLPIDIIPAPTTLPCPRLSCPVFQRQQRKYLSSTLSSTPAFIPVTVFSCEVFYYIFKCVCVRMHSCVCAHVFVCAYMRACVHTHTRMWRVYMCATVEKHHKSQFSPPTTWVPGIKFKPGLGRSTFAPWTISPALDCFKDSRRFPW